MYALSQANQRHTSGDDYAAAAVSSPQTLVSNKDPQVDLENAAHSATKKSNTHHHSSHKRNKKSKKKHHRDRHRPSHANEARERTANKNEYDEQLLITQKDPYDGNRTQSGVPETGGYAAATAASYHRKQPFDRNSDNVDEDIAVEHVEYAEKSTGAVVEYGNEMVERTKPGAIAVGPAGMDEENPYISTVSDSTVQDYIGMDASRTNRETLEARCVSDNEIVQDHAAEIAAMVQRNLMTNATVPVEVRPSTGHQMSRMSMDQQKKRICFVSVGILAIVAAVALGVGLAISKRTAAPSTPPTTTQTAREKAFQAILEQVSGDVLKDGTSPQYQAMNWLANTDAAYLTVGVDSEDTIKTRYVAAVLYYSFQGEDWHKKHNFLSKNSICSWNQNDLGDLVPFGISCGTDDMVESFRSPENNLKGQIPHEITYLSSLSTIDVVNNTIGGTLSNLVNLTRLEYLDLSGNAFTGAFPEFLLTHNELIRLNLDHNRLEGTISQLAGTAPNLKYLWLRENLVSGQIPSAIGQSTVLQSIDLQSNQLTGTIPEFATNSKILHLWLANNKLTGEIPVTVGRLSVLQLLLLSTNQLTGIIPTELGECRNIVHVNFDDNALSGDVGPFIESLSPSLETLQADRNQLEGTIPASAVRTLTKLTFFDLQFNKVGGTLPSELGLLSDLEVLNVAYNELTGSVPSTLANLPKLTNLRLQGNLLVGSVDLLCSIDFEFFAMNTCLEPDKIQCACCTHCCDEGKTRCEFIV